MPATDVLCEQLTRKFEHEKIILLVSLLVVVALFFALDLGQYLTLDYIKSQQQAIDRFYGENRALTLAAYFLLYVVITGASLPGAAALTLAGGAVFGLLTGVVLISFASSIGASIAFLLSRYLFRDAVQSRFGNALDKINRGIDKDGPFYLFALRLVPAFPFFVINLAMGLTRLKLWTFYWVSQLGIARRYRGLRQCRYAAGANRFRQRYLQRRDPAFLPAAGDAAVRRAQGRDAGA